MVPYRYDPEHIAPANNAPRCQHIKLSGHRCGAPARRRRRFCHFHERILRPKKDSFTIQFVEDASSLQWAIMQVLRLIHSPRPDYKACGLSLYALQIACSNLKNFMAEQPNLELPAAQQPQPKPATSEKNKKSAEKNGDEPGSLAELLLGFLAKPEGDPNAPEPRIRSREDYYAAVGEKHPPKAASPGETAAAG